MAEEKKFENLTEEE